MIRQCFEIHLSVLLTASLSLFIWVMVWKCHVTCILIEFLKLIWILQLVFLNSNEAFHCFRQFSIIYIFSLETSLLHSLKLALKLDWYIFIFPCRIPVFYFFWLGLAYKHWFQVISVTNIKLRTKLLDYRLFAILFKSFRHQIWNEFYSDIIVSPFFHSGWRLRFIAHIYTINLLIILRLWCRC